MDRPHNREQSKTELHKHQVMHTAPPTKHTRSAHYGAHTMPTQVDTAPALEHHTPKTNTPPASNHKQAKPPPNLCQMFYKRTQPSARVRRHTLATCVQPQPAGPGRSRSTWESACCYSQTPLLLQHQQQARATGHRLHPLQAGTLLLLLLP